MKSFKSFINEGGAFGHLNHPYDVESFTFNDYKEIISNAFQGNLEYAREKTDATNLMFSWKDGQIVAARSKAHLKNSGKDSMTISDVESKFKGRGLEIAYGEALRDLSAALLKLSSAQRDKIFQNGKSFMSMEVMMPGSSENIIKYGITELRLQDLITYDDDGKPIAFDPKAARMLDGMIRQKRSEKQNTYHIRMLNIVDIPTNKDFSKKKAQYISRLGKIMSDLRVKGPDTIVDVKKKYYSDLLGNIDGGVKEQLMNRWALGDKTIRIANVIKTDSISKEESETIKNIDKGIDSHHKKIIFPLEHLFLSIGADVLQMVEKVMATNPDKTVQALKDDLQSTIDLVRRSGDPKLIDKLEYELHRLDKIGGLNAIVPTEGITFFHKGEILKLTGTFAPLNQIIGLRFRL